MTVPNGGRSATSTWPATAGTALRVAFGVIWAVSAALTWTADFASHYVGYLHNAATGQPAWSAWWFQLWIGLVTPHAGFFVWATRIVETALALALLLGFARKSAYIAGILFSLLVWSTAEGFSGPYSVGANNIGAAISYVLVFAALIVIDLRSGPDPYSLDALIERRRPGWRRFAEWNETAPPGQAQRSVGADDDERGRQLASAPGDQGDRGHAALTGRDDDGDAFVRRAGRGLPCVAEAPAQRARSRVAETDLGDRRLAEQHAARHPSLHRHPTRVGRERGVREDRDHADGQPPRNGEPRVHAGQDGPHRPARPRDHPPRQVADAGQHPRSHARALPPDGAARLGRAPPAARQRHQTEARADARPHRRRPGARRDDHRPLQIGML